MARKQIWMHHASLAWQEGTNANKEDIHTACKLGADVITYTEATRDYRSEIIVAARQHGYQYVMFPHDEEAIMVKKAFQMKNQGHKKVHEGFRDPRPGYNQPARFITWCSMDWHGLRLWIHAAHWVNHIQVQGVVVPGQPSRLAKHIATTDAMIHQVTTHGRSPDLAFFAGDSNVDEGGDNKHNDHRLLNFRFNRAGLKTIWDAFHVAPNTHAHGGYDLIGSYDPRKKVFPARYKVHAKENSDHRPISAWYDIETTPGPNDNPTTPTDNKLIDWSDFGDPTTYDLQWALEDSDAPFHDA